MSKRVCLILAAFVVLLLAPLVASAQQQEPPIFTFVSEWTIARAQWDEFTAQWDRGARQILERMIADGTIVSWGRYMTVVHEQDQSTHGSWYAATSMAAIEKVLAELLKLPPNPAITAAGVKHRDYYLRSLAQKRRAGTGSGAYLWVSSTKVQPGKGQQWRELWDKYTKPVYDELVANGTIAMLSLDVEQVHTDESGWRYAVYIVPNADGLDKVRAAFDAAAQKRGPEANRGVGEAFAAVTVAGAHRDYFARVLNYAQK